MAACLFFLVADQVILYQLLLVRLPVRYGFYLCTLMRTAIQYPKRVIKLLHSPWRSYAEFSGAAGYRCIYSNFLHFLYHSAFDTHHTRIG